MEGKLEELIHYSLQNHLYSNAIFFGERLHAQLLNEHSAYLLASIYYQEGHPNKSYSLLKNLSLSLSFKEQNSTSSTRYSSNNSNNNNNTNSPFNRPENRYLYALCCYELDKLKEAEVTLLGGTHKGN